MRNLNATRRLLLPALCLATVFSLSALVAQAGPNDRYSVITIKNKTQFRVDYSYRWGNSGNWHNNHIPPGGTWRHWWTFDYAGEDYAPWFYLKHDEQSGAFKLRSFYSPDTKAENGREYKFDWDEGSKRIILYSKRYK